MGNVGGVFQFPTSLPPGTTSQDINNQIASAQTQYNTAQSALTALQGDYDAQSQNLQAALATLQNLIQQGATQAEIDAARQQALNIELTFNSSSTSYQAAVANFETASFALASTKAELQLFLDSESDGVLNQTVTNLNGALDPTTYQDLVSINNQREQARATFNADLENFRSNESLLMQARVAVGKLQDTVLMDLVNATGLPSNDPSWTTYNNDLAQLTAQQQNVSAYLSQRGTLKAILDADFTTFENENSNFEAILSQANANNQTISGAIQQAQTTAQNMMNSLYNQAASSDMIAQTQHYLDFPTTNSAQPGQTASINSLYADLQNIVIGSGVATVTPISVTMPNLPSPGQSLSISDLMRFITAIQSLVQQLGQQANSSYTNLNLLRMKIWQLQLGAVGASQALIKIYENLIENSDIQYNNEVNTDNQSTIASLTKSVNNINNNLNAINAQIDIKNQEIQAQNQNAVTVVNNLNTSAQEIVNMLNETLKTTPDALNLLNVLNQDPSTPYPTPLPNPPIVSTPPTIPLLNHISALPPVPTGTPPDPAAVTAFNNAVTQVNLTLYPIANQLGPPINYNLLPLFYVRQTIQVRNITNVFLPAAIFQHLASLYNLVDYKTKESRFLKPEVTITPPAEIIKQVPTTRPDVQPPKTTSATQSIGSGTALVSSDSLAPQSKVNTVLNTIIHKQQFKNTLNTINQQAALIGGLDVAIRLPSQNRNYSEMGVIEREFLSEDETKLQNKKTDELQTTLAASVASQLAQSSTNVSSLKQNALNLIQQSGDLQNLNQDEIKKLLSLLIVLQQLLIGLQAAILVAASGSQESPTDTLSELSKKIDVALSASTISDKNAAASLNAILQTTLTKSLLKPTTGTQAAGTSGNIPSDLLPGTQEFLAEISKKIDANLDDTKRNEITLGLKKIGDTLFNQQQLDALQLAISQNTSASPNTPVQNTTSALQSTATPDQLQSLNQQITGNFIGALTPTAEDITKNLNVNLNAIPPELATSIQNNIQNLPGLNKDQSTALTLALAGGKIDSSQAQNIILNLLISGFVGPNQANFSLIGSQGSSAVNATSPTSESRKPSTMPEDILDQVKDAFVQIAKNTDDDQYVVKLLNDFKTYTEKQTDFYKLSVSLLLDPANAMVKNFSIMTREGKDKDRGMQPPVSIPV